MSILGISPDQQSTQNLKKYLCTQRVAESYGGTRWVFVVYNVLHNTQSFVHMAIYELKIKFLCICNIFRAFDFSR